MSTDPRQTGSWRSPRHLWRGDWRSDSEKARQAAEEEAARRRAAGEPVDDTPAGERVQDTPAADPTHGARNGARAAGAPPRPRTRQPPGLRRQRRLVVGSLLVGLLGLAFGAGALVRGGDDSGVLPAVSDTQVQPRKGQSQAGAVYAAASPAVVSVRTSDGAGTGFLIDSGGKIVTNSHVVGSAKTVTVRFGEAKPSDARVLGADPSSDLAVLSIAAGDIPKDAKPLKFADSRGVRVGDSVIAIGNPFGLDRTATEGIVSGIGRHIAAPNGFSIDQVIQTDAPINPGNSGGPLLDVKGRVIGVNSQIATGGSQGNIGIGFAVPSNSARQVVPRLERGQKIARAHLGIETQAASPGGDVGAEVVRIVPGGPAERAGLRQGDVILKIGDSDVNEPSDVSTAVTARKPGDDVEIRVERGGSVKTLHATLGTRPARTP